MTRRECPDSVELRAWLNGEVDDSRADWLANHADQCSLCSRLLENLDTGDPLLHPIADDLSGHATLDFAAELDQSVVRELIGRPRDATGVSIRKPSMAEHRTGNLVGESLGGYHLTELIGRGGMGDVYRAEHERLRKPFAIKVLPADKLQDTGSLARFDREIRATGQLDHPNIVRATDAGEQDGTHYLVMECVDGINLSTLSTVARPLTPDDACELIRQAAVGLQHAFENGLVHRDVKPSNLMLTSDGTVRILDFGLARLRDDQMISADEITTAKTVMGTVDYMAPEQCDDSHSVDIRADIYSLGATLYKLLTGRAPFDDPRYDTPYRKLVAIATQKPDPIGKLRPDVPAGLSELIQAMLSRKPAERPSHPVEVADALQEFCCDADLPDLYARANKFSRSPGAPASSDDELAATGTFTDSVETITRAEDGIASDSRHETEQTRSIAKSSRTTTPIRPVAIALVVVALVAAVFKWWPQSQTEAEAPSSSVSNTRIEVESVQGTDRELETGDGTQDSDLKVIGADRYSSLLEMWNAVRGTEEGVEIARRLSETHSPFDTLNRADIDAGELLSAGEGDTSLVPDEVVAILGDSRFLLPGGLPNSRISISPDDRFIAAAEHNGECVHVFDSGTGHRVYVRPDASHAEFDREGHLVLSAGNSAIEFIDPETWGLARRLECAGVRRLSFNHDRSLMVSSGERITLWNMSIDGPLQSWPAPGGPTALAISPDGKMVAGCFVVGGQNRFTLRVWDVESPNEIADLKREDGKTPQAYSLMFSADGNRLFAGGGYQWSTHDWSLLSKMPPTTFGTAVYFPTEVKGQILSFNHRPHSGHVSAYWIDTRLHRVVREREFPGGVFIRRDGSIHETASDRLQKSESNRVSLCGLMPDGQSVLLTDPSGGQAVWDPVTGGRAQVESDLLLNPVTGSPSNTESSSFGLTSNIRNWVFHRSIDFGKTLTARAHEGTRTIHVTASDAESGSLLKKFEPAGQWSSVAISDDEKQIASGSIGGEIAVWSVVTGDRTFQATIESGMFPALAFSPDGLHIATASHARGESIRIWSLQSPDSPVAELPHTRCSHLEFSPDGHLLASTGDDGWIRIWNLATKEEISTISVGVSSASGVWQMRFLPDSRHLLCTYANNTVRVLRLRSHSARLTDN